ncbi:inositol hexaphosphate kinase 3 [Mucor ambiguus]|uniref:Kinase n=1 Tax=Mucor ambiguus TaxID=91626 RepID=A0A0C9MP56_9FUNG|nr:inositol hexaphosphate kinase 3 [Mucor ambiguus]
MDTASLVHFDQQVAGHDQLMALPTSDLIVVKPCKKKELEFYQDAHSFPEFQDFLPECYGTVRAATESDLKILDDSALNLLHGFTRPCILDLKMGSLLYDSEATDEKRMRMTRQSISTTSSSLGLRICGMKVYDPINKRYATYEKIYGKSRTADNTVEAILAYLFPTSSYGTQTEDYRTYVDDNTSTSTTREKILTKYSRWVIECFIDTLKEIQESLIDHPNLRLIGSSILFMYEGDRSAADKTWKQMLAEDKAAPLQDQAHEIVAETEDELPPKMCDLRLIDFAHSDWHADRKRQDPELLRGFENIIHILEQCLAIQHKESL